MPQLNEAAKEITFKFVFHGPGSCGKTTSLEAIHAKLDPSHRGEIISLNTTPDENDRDRTLFLDLLPASAGRIGRYGVTLHLVTVPGQVHYEATRAHVLEGADGILFVADSDPRRRAANVQSMRDLYAHVAAQGRSVARLPMVLQYNKQDLPGALPTEQLQQDLNPRDLPAFLTVATRGEGVMAALAEVYRQARGAWEEGSLE